MWYSSDRAVSSTALRGLVLLVRGNVDGWDVVADVGDEGKDAGEGIHLIVE